MFLNIHLANKGEITYPATYNEHLNGWHRGNYQKGLPGEPIKYISDFLIIGEISFI